MSTERKTVTLFLYIPKEKKVVLSRRGDGERKPGLLQATVHGQIEPGEISQIAIKREFQEEAKGDFHQLTNIVDLGDAKVGDQTVEHTFYHAAIMPDGMLQDLQPTQEVSEFVLVSEDQVKDIVPYSKAKADASFDYKQHMAMFDDEIDVLKKVFKSFEKM